MRTLIKLLFLLFVCSGFKAFPQTEISGTVKDSKNKPVPSATITLKSVDGKIAAFSRTNEKGLFNLKLPAETIGLQLEISSLGYKKQTVPLVPARSSYNVNLHDSAIDLPTVVINNRPALKATGDTLSYKLSDFSEKQDRVLGDVLKKMPGIEVASNGKISYNGKNISNFYIDGDNLLDDKYNIATKSIPKEMVDKVQVIENDQPVKMLRGKSNSEDVALNITIKDEAKLKLAGQASLGAGFPEKFDVNANAMMFNKKYKGINYLKGNNIGKDPAQDLVSHNLSDYLRRIENGKPGALLSSGAAGVPDLPQNRYLFNQAGLFNVNNLFNLKKDVQLKTNVYYLFDKQKREYNKSTDIFLPTGNVGYTESQNNISRPQLLHAQASLNMNRDKSYLNNVFMADYNPTSYRVDLVTNNLPLQQHLSQKPFDISNEFNYMNTLKSGNVYNIYSYVNYINQPERLTISPGLNQEQFNDGTPYASLVQNAKVPSYFTNNYIAFKHNSLNLFQTYKTGFNLQSQHLQSSLDAVQNNQRTLAATADALNDLNWNSFKVYGEGNYEYKSTDERLKITVNIPLSYQNIHYKDPGHSLDKQLERFFVSPRANIKYMTSIENYLTASYGLRNELGGLDDIYQGAILKNYRTLFANNAPVTERRSQTAALGFNYRKAITMFFFNVQAMYSKIHVNTISSSIITDNLQQRIVLPFGNDISSYSLSGSISKYLFALRSTVSAGANWSQNNSSQIQNNELLPYKSENNTFKAGLQSKISKNINLNYAIDYSLIKTKTAANAGGGTKYNQIKQQADLSVNVLSNLFFTLTAEHLYTRQSGQEKLSYLFSDLTLRYKANKINTDFEIGVNNLANIKTYKAIYTSTNMLTSGTYLIPGRIGVFKATFNF
ncbi:carboxypeptidase-like regulatory domain-containing protein [Pedobacter nutrimenti]|uniref:Carboxypeptidase family protein n=1 Tax=Pedobacter nutrimenti TaxID=1241337 RepID=A0A318UGG8_9SPHI|nr:carboxypeptidase-like regulatory domain-containing protein [Pedobacter nutrimenti]PYF74457.1 carboxypeptidase family protein [Pedobacter nutrimenti]